MGGLRGSALILLAFSAKIASVVDGKTAGLAMMLGRTTGKTEYPDLKS
jgi:hypothetical protein